MMNTNWSREELEKIAKSDDLHIAPFRGDGSTYGTLTWIWSVVVNDSLFVRAYHGRASRWYQSALQQKAGKITVGGMTKEVAFEPVEGAINNDIDKAYRQKYSGSPYLASMISERARAASVQILPR